MKFIKIIDSEGQEAYVNIDNIIALIPHYGKKQMSAALVGTDILLAYGVKVFTPDRISDIRKEIRRIENESCKM